MKTIRNSLLIVTAVVLGLCGQPGDAFERHSLTSALAESSDIVVLRVASAERIHLDGESRASRFIRVHGTLEGLLRQTSGVLHGGARVAMCERVPVAVGADYLLFLSKNATDRSHGCLAPMLTLRVDPPDQTPRKVYLGPDHYARVSLAIPVHVINVARQVTHHRHGVIVKSAHPVTTPLGSYILLRDLARLITQGNHGSKLQGF